MTKDDIIRMAHEARFYIQNDEAYSPFNQADHELTEHLERFAKLVAEHEREACAKEAATTFYSVQAAENIRARGQA
jgi:hypothetical protein